MQSFNLHTKPEAAGSTFAEESRLILQNSELNGRFLC